MANDRQGASPDTGNAGAQAVAVRVYVGQH